MNKLPIEKRRLILSMLCKGSSMRSISRIADVSINTVTKLLADAGDAAIRHHSESVHDVKASRVQCDEIWSFCYAKQKNVKKATAAPQEAGDVWTWTAIDADTKLIIHYLIGGRDAEYALEFIDGLRQRLANRVQLTTDGHNAYLQAVEEAFGADVDFAQLVKIYGQAPEGQRRYSPAICIGAKKRTVTGNPDMAEVSTSYVERQNLTMRMSMRRFTRLTNAFSKKFDNHVHALALYFYHYNFCRVHKSLRVTPAMKAGLTDRVWSFDDLITAMDEAAPAPAKRGPYKKKGVKLDNHEAAAAVAGNSN